MHLLRITVTKIPTFFDNHKHSGTSHRLAMTIQAVPAAACQIPIVRGISLITNIAKPPNRFKEIERNRFIFIKKDLCPEMHRIVLLHEIGHAVLHRNEAKLFSDLNLFHMKNDRMEYEANCFAAEVALPDDEVLNYIQEGFDMEQIAKAMNTDINLVAMKAANLNRKGYSFRLQNSRSDFLKF